MKKNVVFVAYLFFILFAISSQEIAAVPSFLGVEWGKSQEEVDKMMLSKGFLPEEGKRNHPAYIGTFAGRRATVLCYFKDDQFISAYVFVSPRKSPETDFWELEGGINNKYGFPNGDTILTLHKKWDFEKMGAIALEMLSDSVCISYFDGISARPYDKDAQALFYEEELSDL